MKLRIHILFSTWLCFSPSLHAHSLGHNKNHEERSEEFSFLDTGRDILGGALNIAGFLHTAKDLYKFNPYAEPKSELAKSIIFLFSLETFYIMSFIGLLDLMDFYGHSVEFLSYASDLTGIEKLKYFEDFMISPHVLVVNSVGIAHHFLRELFRAQDKQDWARLTRAHNLIGCAIHGFNILTYMLSNDKKPATKTLEPSENSI